MKGMSLFVEKDVLVRALSALSAVRRRRIGLTPVWLSFDEQVGELSIGEAKAPASATVPATGYWPPTGATVDLAHFRGAVTKTPGPAVSLIMLEDAILVPRPTGHVRLGLLPYGDEPVSLSRSPVATDGRPVGLPEHSLPLFEWAAGRRIVEPVFIDFRGRPAVIGPSSAFVLQSPGVSPYPLVPREFVRDGRSFDRSEWFERFQRPYRRATLHGLVCFTLSFPRGRWRGNCNQSG